MSASVKVTFLGTCSGTEPMPGRHHTALTVETDGRLFWFDAGECCAYTAHLAGLDLPATEAIFISHTHMDHIGGLPNLLWTLRKLTSCDEKVRQRLTDRRIELYIPGLEVYDAVQTILRATEGGFKTVFSIEPKACVDGLLYDREGVGVRALHNLHLSAEPVFRSFSFRMELGGKRIVYSGDVKHISDFAPLIDPCDLLLMETGHHQVEAVCRYLLESGKSFGRLVFVHHGRAILNDPAGELAKARALLGDKVSIAEDGQTMEL